MIRLNKKIYFVEGYVNAAIYDLQNEKVYSLNNTAKNIIQNYINYGINHNYISMLKNNNFINDLFISSDIIKINSTNCKIKTVWLEITEKCNLRCLHCYEGMVHQESRDQLSINDWYNVVSQLSTLGVEKIIIIGGEPCCNYNLLDILKYISKFDIKIIFFSNCTLLSDELIKYISMFKIYVKVSIYGNNAKIHDQITGIQGSFAKTLKNIKKLLNLNVIVEPAVIIMKENELYIDEIISWCKTLGMNYKRFDVIRRTESENYNLHMVTNSHILKTVYRTKPNFNITEKIFFSNLLYNSCWVDRIAIKGNGDIIPCVFSRNIIYGNIKNNKISDIIKSEKAMYFRKLNFDKINTCKQCEFRYSCKDCRFLAYSENKNILDKNPRCTYNVYNGVWTPIEI